MTARDIGWVDTWVWVSQETAYKWLNLTDFSIPRQVALTLYNKITLPSGSVENFKSLCAVENFEITLRK